MVWFDVLGGNTGIGKATALDLAGRGVRIILACRNQKKAVAAINDIKKVRTITSDHWFKRFEYLLNPYLLFSPQEAMTSCSWSLILEASNLCELLLRTSSNLSQDWTCSSIMQVSQTINTVSNQIVSNIWLSWLSTIWILWGTCGTVFKGFFMFRLVADGRTEDGFGIEFGVNHLGHFSAHMSSAGSSEGESCCSCYHTVLHGLSLGQDWFWFSCRHQRPGLREIQLAVLPGLLQQQTL